MIDQKDVVRMRVPFPSIDSNLAVQSHMYVCMQNGTQKEFIKCQRFKPQHLIKNKFPRNKIIESVDIDRNPFMDKTTIDCDKAFNVEKVTIDKSLLTTKRKDICEDLFNNIREKIKHSSFYKEPIDRSSFLSLNHKIKVQTD